MGIWEKITGKKKTAEIVEPMETVETLDQKIRDLNNERKMVLEKQDMLRKEGAWIGEKTPRLKEIDGQLKGLNDQRNTLWEKRRHEEEKAGQR